MSRDINTESLAADHDAGVTIAELARIYGVSETTIYRRLRSLGKRRNREPRTQFKRNVPSEDIAAEYHDGASLSRLAAKYDVSPGTIARRLRGLGIDLREYRVEPEAERFPHGFRWVRRGLIQVPAPLPAPTDGAMESPVRISEFVPVKDLPACPACGSVPGRRCVALSSGNAMSNPHKARLAPMDRLCRGCGGEPRTARAHYCEPCHQKARAATYRRYDRTQRRAS